MPQSSSVIALIRAGTSQLGCSAEGGRKFKHSEGAGKGTVQTVDHMLPAGRKERDLSGEMDLKIMEG